MTFGKACALIMGAVVVWSVCALASQKTTNDGIYSEAQADAAKAPYVKLCSECHAFTVAALKQPKDLPLGDEPFLKKWEGRTLDELLTLIVTTMPNDGSAVVSDEEALNLLAYVLQQNGFAPGKAPLDKAGAAAVIERPKQK